MPISHFKEVNATCVFDRQIFADLEAITFGIPDGLQRIANGGLDIPRTLFGDVGRLLLDNTLTIDNRNI